MTAVPRLRIAAERQVTQLVGLAGTPRCGLVVQGSWEFEESGYGQSTIEGPPPFYHFLVVRQHKLWLSGEKKTNQEPAS